MSIITRFAPSPTNNLHLGHIYSARLSYDVAKNKGGKFLLRIEDIDHTRCKDEYTRQMLDDLQWLGLSYDGDVRHQSAHMADYAGVLDKLDSMGVVYPCFCTKKEIRAEIERSGHAPHASEHLHYPGTCRDLPQAQRAENKVSGAAYALRLDTAKAIAIVGRGLTWHDDLAGQVSIDDVELSDIVLARKDIGTSYHISVVHDDHLQGVTDIIRGVDLFETTHVHRVLQALLGYNTPRYHHHGLLNDPETGYRFAKRDNSMTIKMMRDQGMTAEELLKLVDQYAAISVAGL